MTQVNKNAVVSEKNTMPVEGKAILLVDDQTATGSSLIAGKDYLLSQGANEVRTMCLFSKKKPLADYYAKEDWLCISRGARMPKCELFK